MLPRILITGFGVVSSIGRGKEETLASLRMGRRALAKPRYLKSSLMHLPVGEVDVPNRPGVPRTVLLGEMALKEALAHARLSAKDLAKAALISGTTVGGMDLTEAAFPAYGGAHDCGATTEDIADAVGGFSMATTLSTACSSAANALMLGANLIRAGRADIVAAGGSECLSDYHLNGFNSLMILDSELCRPFDKTRAGLNLGEGAAFLILESEASVLKRGVKPIAELAGYANACDAFHQTASSPDGEGAFLAMQGALKMAGLTPADVDYVNAHGTGTPNNDPSESAALRRLFGDALPPVSSTKGLTGHTTSASGSIEASFCLLAMQHGFLPANAGWAEADPDCIRPYTALGESREVSVALCNAFGFGGNDSSLCLKKL